MSPVERKRIGKRYQWIDRRSPYHYTVTSVDPERESVNPTEAIDRVARPVETGRLSMESRCQCGVVLAHHEYDEEDGVYRVSFLHPSLRLRPQRHANGLRHFGPDHRAGSGRTPRRRDEPTTISGAVYADCPGCGLGQAVIGLPSKVVDDPA